MSGFRPGRVPVGNLSKEGRQIRRLRAHSYFGVCLLLCLAARSFSRAAGKSGPGVWRLAGGPGLSGVRHIPDMALRKAAIRNIRTEKHLDVVEGAFPRWEPASAGRSRGKRF